MKLSPGMALPTFEASDSDGVVATNRDYRGRLLWLVLGRYASCPFCSLRLRELARRFRLVDESGVEVLVVFPSPLETVRKHVQRYAPPFRVAADPDERMYRDFGSETSLAGEIRISLDAPTVAQALRHAKMNPLRVDGHFLLMPAEFLVGRDGTIARVHYSARPDGGLAPQDVVTWARGLSD